MKEGDKEESIGGGGVTGGRGRRGEYERLEWR